MSLATTITEEQLNMLLPLTHRKSCRSLENLVNGITLDWFQTYSVAYALVVKNVILSLDTGLGKTLIACAVMNWYKKAFPHLKWIYLVERNNYEQTLNKLRQHTDLAVVGTTGESDAIVDAFVKTDIDTIDCVVLTYEAIRSLSVNKYLFRERRFFKNLIVDESHNLGNISSQVYKLVRALCVNMEFKMFMTATPLKVSPRQMIAQYEMLNREAFQETDYEGYARQFEVRDDLGKVVDYQFLDELAHDIQLHYVNFTRDELGLKGKYRVRLRMCDSPMDLAVADIKRSELARELKSRPNCNALAKLKDECLEHIFDGKKGLVYANQNAIKDAVGKALADAGLKVEIVDGRSVNRKRREQILNLFKAGEIDVVVTNITAGLDLPCDFIIMYELSVDIKQLIGRAERGLQGNSIDLSFYITKDSEEIDYFINNIYKRGILLQEVCKKDVSELKKAKRDLDLTNHFS